MNEYNLSTLVEKSQAVPVKAKEKSIEEEIKLIKKLKILNKKKNKNYKKLKEKKKKKN